MEAGSALGRYSIESRLARGGMAEVWLATFQGVGGFKKRVVLKTIIPELAENQDFVKMFINEALLAARLNHPHIVQIFDLGNIDGRYFIAMEYVPGRSMRQISRAARHRGSLLPQWFVLRSMAAVCEALQYAHDAVDDSSVPLGLVHRDVTPENIMVSFTGSVKVVDFGVARASTLAPLTQAGTLKGKYSYISPEQVKGAVADRRSDIYSCGVVLYELLTGTRPFKAENDLDLLRQVAKGEKNLPSAIASWVPPEVESIVLTAMAVDKEARYQQASELGEDLLGYLTDTRDRHGQREASMLTGILFPDEPLIPSDVIRRAKSNPALTQELFSDVSIVPPPGGRKNPNAEYEALEVEIIEEALPPTSATEATVEATPVVADPGALDRNHDSVIIQRHDSSTFAVTGLPLEMTETDPDDKGGWLDTLKPRADGKPGDGPPAPPAAPAKGKPEKKAAPADKPSAPAPKKPVVSDKAKKPSAPAKGKTPSAVKAAPAKVKTPSAVKAAPAKSKTPAKAAPAKAKTPAKAAPAKAKTPAKAAPAKAKTPAKAAPAKAKTPAKAAPAKAKTPAKAAPAKAAPAKARTTSAGMPTPTTFGKKTLGEPAGPVTKSPAKTTAKIAAPKTAPGIKPKPKPSDSKAAKEAKPAMPRPRRATASGLPISATGGKKAPAPKAKSPKAKPPEPEAPKTEAKPEPPSPKAPKTEAKPEPPSPKAPAPKAPAKDESRDRVLEHPGASDQMASLWDSHGPRIAPIEDDDPLATMWSRPAPARPDDHNKVTRKVGEIIEQVEDALKKQASEQWTEEVVEKDVWTPRPQLPEDDDADLPSPYAIPTGVGRPVDIFHARRLGTDDRDDDVFTSFRPVNGMPRSVDEPPPPAVKPEDGVWSGAAVPETPEREAARYFDEGLEMMRRREYVGALQQWEQALALVPDNRVYQSNLKKLEQLLDKERGDR